MSYIDFKEFKASDHFVDLGYVVDDSAGILRKGSIVGIIAATKKIALSRWTHATDVAFGGIEEGEPNLEIPVTEGEETRFRVDIDSVTGKHGSSEISLGLVTAINTTTHTITVTEDASDLIAGDPIYVNDGSQKAIGILDEDVEGVDTNEITKKMKKVLVHGAVYKTSLPNYYSEVNAQIPLIKFI